MARMSIDDMFARDTRMFRLANMLGWSRRETRACLEDVWALCYDRGVPYLPREDIEVTAMSDAIEPPANGQAFVDSLLEVGLARAATTKDRHHVKKDGTKIAWKDQRWQGRIYLAGASERVGYLLDRQRAGSAGGLKSGESRRNRAKHSSSTAQARRNPSSPDLPPDPSSPSVGVPDPARELAELAEDLTPPPPEISVSPNWEPPDTPETRAAETSAEKRGVLVEYCRRKFIERWARQGGTLVGIASAYREALLTEFPTKPEIRAAFDRERREATERAARDREREVLAEQERRAAADREEVRRMAKTALDSNYRSTAAEKATA